MQEEWDRKNKFPQTVMNETKKQFPPKDEVEKVIKRSKEAKTNLSNEKLKNISNREFLSISPARRLENITKNNIKSEKVADWTESSLEFTFTFDDQFNEELYKKTTAGQVLPKEVRTVTQWGAKYIRTWLKWEFFKEWTNRRLIIREGTHIDKIEIWDIKKLEEKNSKLTEEFIKNNPESKDFSDIVTEAYNRWIEPWFAILAFSENIKNLQFISIERQVVIEEMFTEFSRKRTMVMWAIVKNSMEWKYEKWKYTDELAIRVLKEFGWDKWKDKAKEYWITKERINTVETQIQARFASIDLSNLPKWVKWLLDVIASKESGGNYNAEYWNANQYRIDFTSMSVNQILEHQRVRISRWQQSAIWKYQFINKTLKWMVQRWLVSGNEKFDEDFQDKIATIKLKERGLDSFMSWRISRDKFQSNLSQEWASLPKDSSNSSYYAGDWLNKSHISDYAMNTVLDNLKNEWYRWTNNVA